MSEYTEFITRLYIGYFNRVPDPDGLKYWVEQVVNGQCSCEQLVESFAQSQEALALYPYLAERPNDDSAGFINSIYLNTFGREADVAGLTYWQAELEAGFPPSKLVWQLIQVVEDEEGTDSQSLANRVKVSESMHELLAHQWTAEVGEFGRFILMQVDEQQISVDQAIYQLLNFVQQNNLSQKIEKDALSTVSLTEAVPSESEQYEGNYSGDDQTVVVIDSAWSNYWDSGDLLYSWDFADNDGDVLSFDPDGHGAWVTQVIVDVAPDAQVIRLKVFSDDVGLASMNALDQAFDWVIENINRYSIDVVNISLGGGNTEVYTDTQFSDDYAALADAGVITTVAAGNRGETYSSGISLIAADPNVIAVSASNGNGQLEPWSQRHPELTDLVADGVWPLTDLTGFNVTAEGTSFSAPAVAGAILLAQEAAMDIRGEALTQAEFLSIARQTGNSLGADGYTELNTAVLMDYLVNYLSQTESEPFATGFLMPDQTGYMDQSPESFDTIYGQLGGHWQNGWSDEQLIGTTGNEYFAFNYGDDNMIGGGGSDVFQFNAATGHDHIADFNPDNDFLDLGEYAYRQDTHISASDDHTLISLADGLSTIKLHGVTSADWNSIRDVSAANFLSQLYADFESIEPELQTDNGEQYQPVPIFDLV